MNTWWDQIKLLLVIFIVVVIVMLLEQFFASLLTDEQKTMQIQEQIKSVVKFTET